MEFTKDPVFKRFWRCRGTIPGPHTCKACALPLSYIPKLQSQWGLSREKGLIAKSSAAFAFQFQTKKTCQEVLGSNPGAPSESIANWVCHRTHKEYDKCHLLCFSREAIRFGFSIVCHNCSTRTQINPRAFDQQGWSCFFPYCSSQDGRAV